MIHSSASRHDASASRRHGRTVLAGGRVAAEELDVGDLGAEVPEAVGHELVGHVALEVDDEAVVAEGLLGGAGLELGEVDRPGRELLEDRQEGARPGRPAGTPRSSSCRGRSAAGSRLGPPPRSGSGCPGGRRCRRPARRGRRSWRRARGRRRRSGRRPQRPRSGPPRRWSWRPPPRRPGSSRANQARHWPAATGKVRTRRTSASPTPGGAIRLSWMPRTTSRWMRRSCSRARASMVTVTVPSIEFSMPHEAEVELAVVHGGEHLGEGAQRDELLGGQVGLRAAGPAR